MHTSSLSSDSKILNAIVLVHLHWGSQGIVVDLHKKSIDPNSDTGSCDTWNHLTEATAGNATIANRLPCWLL